VSVTPLTSFKDKQVAVFGLGTSGLVSAQALIAGGAKVVTSDDSVAGQDKARALGIAVEDFHDADFGRFSSLVLAPGVPLTHPKPHWIVEKARAAGLEIIGDIELFCRERKAIAPRSLFIAITGTNGKSTTTALVAHLFKCFGFEVAVGGNIGTPILALPPPGNNLVHVIECSSYQIDLAPSLNPWVGVLLNITPDHLDRHGTMENYAAIKARLVQKADLAVIAIDGDYTLKIAEDLQRAKRPGTTISITRPGIEEGLVLMGTKLVRKVQGRALPIADLAGIASLRGTHNGQNALAGVAALGSYGYDTEKLGEALRSFPGLAHRMEDLGLKGKVLFINDSKATNADAAEKALLCFDKVFWILGGRQKEGGIEPLRGFFPKITKGYLIGEASEAFAKTIGEAFPVEFCGALEKAVAKAYAEASQSPLEKPIVLLSPACASFDQYPDFEKRGDHFRALVAALPDHSAEVEI
jgi:UDP-N-acetylmuramoylalanine--D-glutamate ligase